MRQLHRLLRFLARDAVRRTFIESHGDVDAESLLNIDRALRRKKMRRAVDVRTKLDTVFAEFANGRERENLKAAGIRKNSAIPRHEFVNSAQLLDDVDARAKHQVIGV